MDLPSVHIPTVEARRPHAATERRFASSNPSPSYGAHKGTPRRSEPRSSPGDNTPRESF
jgi:hypothetical protein